MVLRVRVCCTSYEGCGLDLGFPLVLYRHGLIAYMYLQLITFFFCEEVGLTCALYCHYIGNQLRTLPLSQHLNLQGDDALAKRPFERE